MTSFLTWRKKQAGGCHFFSRDGFVKEMHPASDCNTIMPEIRKETRLRESASAKSEALKLKIKKFSKKNKKYSNKDVTIEKL